MVANVARFAVDLDPATEARKAAVVTEIHLAAHDGRCEWCWDAAGVWTPHPCTVYRWAARVAQDEQEAR